MIKEYTLKVLIGEKFDNYINLKKDIINSLKEIKEINNPFILKEIYAFKKIQKDRTFEVCIRK